MDGWMDGCYEQTTPKRHSTFLPLRSKISKSRCSKEHFKKTTRRPPSRFSTTVSFTEQQQSQSCSTNCQLSVVSDSLGRKSCNSTNYCQFANCNGTTLYGAVLPCIITPLIDLPTQNDFLHSTHSIISLGRGVYIHEVCIHVIFCISITFPIFLTCELFRKRN